MARPIGRRGRDLLVDEAPKLEVPKLEVPKLDAPRAQTPALDDPLATPADDASAAPASKQDGDKPFVFEPPKPSVGSGDAKPGAGDTGDKE